MLPSGDTNDDNHLLLIVKVMDRYGASSRAEMLIKVTPAQITSEDISKAADQAAELASQGDGMESLAFMAIMVGEAKVSTHLQVSLFPFTIVILIQGQRGGGRGRRDTVALP